MVEQAPNDDVVEVGRTSDGWIVRIREDGTETVTPFVDESFALSFAEGQRIRLGLAKIERTSDASRT